MCESITCIKVSIAVATVEIFEGVEGVVCWAAADNISLQFRGEGIV